MRTVYLAIMTLSYMILSSLLLNSLLSFGLVLSAPSYTSNTQNYTQISSSLVGRSFAPKATYPVQSSMATAAPVSAPVVGPSQSLHQHQHQAHVQPQPQSSAPRQFVAKSLPHTKAQEFAQSVQPAQQQQKSVHEPTHAVQHSAPTAQQLSGPVVQQSPVPVVRQSPAPAVQQLSQTVPSHIPSNAQPTNAEKLFRLPVQNEVHPPSVPMANLSASETQKSSSELITSPAVTALAAPVSAPAPKENASAAISHVAHVVQPVPEKVAQALAPTPARAPVQPVQSIQQSQQTTVQEQMQKVESSGGNKDATSFALTSLVRGGLGPLHLLAETLCDPQPELPNDDSTALYAQRQSVRKALFDFMSLKFTDLGKLSSRLSGETASPSTKVYASSPTAPLYAADASVGQAVVVSQHQSPAWPVIGKCTSQDLKLMAEAAWCDCPESSSSCKSKTSTKLSTVEHQQNHQQQQPAQLVLQTANQTVLVQQQLADDQQRRKERENECKKKSLRLAKNLFNHLAENQSDKSASWPSLYTELVSDDCARQRLIDIVNALASFRSVETVRRDNVEFAFAMDDLRVKVLDSDSVTSPLQVDGQFIAFEQFLQQSVQLVLSNIDPQRSRLSSARYRSLLPGPVSADDQCVELHQRLLSRHTYASATQQQQQSASPDHQVAHQAAGGSPVSMPSSAPTPSASSSKATSEQMVEQCSPNQLGQLSDVLRMTAKSLELWSLELDLSRHNKRHASGYTSAARRQEIVDCVSNLVDKPSVALRR